MPTEQPKSQLVTDYQGAQVRPRGLKRESSESQSLKSLPTFQLAAEPLKPRVSVYDGQNPLQQNSIEGVPSTLMPEMVGTQKFRNNKKTIHKVIKVYDMQTSLPESNSVELPAEEELEASNLRYSKHGPHTQQKTRSNKAQAISSIKTLQFQVSNQQQHQSY